MKLECLKRVNENVDIDEYMKFSKLVKESMKHPEWLGDFSKEDLINMQKNGSVIWIYYLGDESVCSMMMIPSTEKDLKKLGINLAYRKVVDYGPMFVNPKYVGNKLQYQMLKQLDDYCAKLGYEYAVSTVHPDNVYSLRNLLKDDFKLVKTKKLTRGVRNVYLKCISTNHE